jgi:hypothetical protein
MNQEYNGWANWETWNVALWIGNDESLYHDAKYFRNKGFKEFAEYLRGFGIVETPDGAAYNDSGLDIEALDKMLGEL